MSTKVITGSQLQAAMWHESTWGSETPTTAYALPVSVANLAVCETQEFIDSQVARGGRKEQVPYPGTITADGNSFVVPAHYCSVLHHIKQFVANTIVTTGATAPYTHAATLGNLPVGLGMEFALVDPTPANSLLYRAYGCRVTQVTIPIAKAAGEMDLQFQINAKKVVKTTGTPITATSYTESPIVFSDMTVFTINDGGGADAITDVIEATLTLSQETEYQHTANNSGRVGMYASGLARVRGTLRALLQDASAYEALAEAGTYFALQAKIVSGTDSIQIDLPHCRLFKRPISVSGPLGIGIDAEFGAYEDPNDATSPMTVTVTNAEDGGDW